jgi:nicotinamidase-related amidase
MTITTNELDIGPFDRTALILIDYQRGLCLDGPTCVAPPLAEQVAARGVLPSVAKVLSAARSAGVLVLYTRLAFDPGYVLRTNLTQRFDRYPAEKLLQYDDDAAQIVPELAPDGEVVLTKGGVNPFIGTALTSVLLGRGIGTVVLGGVSTNLAVESAARHAADIGLQPIVVEDSCASFNPEIHDLAVTQTLPLFARVVPSRDVISAFGA